MRFGPTRGWLSVLALLPLLLAVLWFRANYEKKAVQVQDRSGREQSAFAASAAYLRATGHEVAEREGLRFFASLPEPDTTLMLYALPTSGRDGLHLRLLGWVARGGHLIVPAPAEPLSPQQKNFLRRVGAVRFSGDKAPGRGDLLLRGTVLGQPVILDIGSPPSLAPQPPFLPEWRLDGELMRDCDQHHSHQGCYEWMGMPPPFGPNPVFRSQGDWAERFRLGQGRVTLLSGIQPFTGEGLGKRDRDNAFLLSALVRGHKAVCLWLPGQGQADSLLRQLLHRYPTTLAGLLLLLAVLIWQRQSRLHPPLPLPEPARRDVLAYFTGAGRFAWRINRAARLLADNQESLARERRLQSGRNPRDDGAPGAQLSESGSRSPAGAAPGPVVQNEDELLRLSQDMFRLKQSLRRAGPGRHRT